MAPKRLQVGIVGLGRMGRRHATNFLERTFRADVVAAWAFDEREAEWGYQQLQPHGATIYTDYDRFLQHAGLEAVVIATVAGAHADQAIKAIEQEKHVLCEKPLSISAEIVRYISQNHVRIPFLHTSLPLWNYHSLNPWSTLQLGSHT